jgi:hypothetical protein
VRQPIAIGSIVTGTALSAGAMWTGAPLLAWLRWNPIAAPHTAHVQDTYFIVGPSLSISIVIFAVGVLVGLAFRARASTFGRRAVVVWWVHLLCTTALIVMALAAHALATTLYGVLFGYAVPTLLLLVHGVGLMAGGLVVLRSRRPSPGG